MAKSLFIDETDLEKIDLGDGFWVEIPLKISYGMAQDLFNNDSKADSVAIGKKILLKFIKSWNLTDKDGAIAKISEKNINKLPFEIIQKITPIIEAKLYLNKKK